MDTSEVLYDRVNNDLVISLAHELSSKKFPSQTGINTLFSAARNSLFDLGSVSTDTLLQFVTKHNLPVGIYVVCNRGQRIWRQWGEEKFTECNTCIPDNLEYSIVCLCDIGHYVAFGCDKHGRIFFFDSLGRFASNYFNKLGNRTWFTFSLYHVIENKPIQGYFNTLCGGYCVLWIWTTTARKSFEPLACRDMWGSDMVCNDFITLHFCMDKELENAFHYKSKKIAVYKELVKRI